MINAKDIYSPPSPRRYESCSMEMEEIQTDECKFPRMSNKEDEQYQKYDVDDVGEVKKSSGLGGIVKFYGRPSSRIVRVSRASGGKDRHSKVLTSKGLRDRRVRLSVNTAIQFYDLQDRLGCDQPSKAVEWLLKAAAPSIAELPPLEAFPDTLQLSDEKRSSEPGFDSADVEMDDDLNYNQQQQPCCSNSETSKGSGLSLSRSDSRLKARERAKERATEKEKEKENKSCIVAQHHQNMHPSSSFTELLTGGMSDNNNSNTSPNGNIHQNTPRQWSTNPLEYFTSGLLGPSATRGIDSSSGQIYLGNPLQPLRPVSSPMFSITGEHRPELQHFPFGGDNLVPGVTSRGPFSPILPLLCLITRGFLPQTDHILVPQLNMMLVYISSMEMGMTTATDIQIRKEKERTKLTSTSTAIEDGSSLWSPKRKLMISSATSLYIICFLIPHSALFILSTILFLWEKSLCLLLLARLQLVHRFETQPV